MVSDTEPNAVFKPFANDTDVLSIHGDALTITNDPVRIVLSGSMEITRDKAGLAVAATLADTLARIVECLRAEVALPEKVADEPLEKTGQVQNPFV